MKNDLSSLAAKVNERELNELAQKFESSKTEGDQPGVLKLLCAVFNIAKPILERLIEDLPPKLKRVIQLLIRVIDSIC